MERVPRPATASHGAARPFLATVWLFIRFGELLLIRGGCGFLLALLPLPWIGVRPVFRAYPVLAVMLPTTRTRAGVALARVRVVDARIAVQAMGDRRPVADSMRTHRAGARARLRQGTAEAQQ